MNAQDSTRTGRIAPRFISRCNIATAARGVPATAANRIVMPASPLC